MNNYITIGLTMRTEIFIVRPELAIKGRPCIYIIRNTVNGKVYVGKTKCLYKRCHQYIYDFKNRAIGHLNDYLYRSMVKHGIDKFEMLPVEFSSVEQLDELELSWMKVLKSTDRLKGYNLRMDTSTGMVASLETSQKISSNLKSQWASGIRDGHAKKLKQNWADNPHRRTFQSSKFTEIKTVYSYVVQYPDKQAFNCTYKELKALGLHSVLSTYHRKRCDSAIIKGINVTRVKL